MFVHHVCHVRKRKKRKTVHTDIIHIPLLKVKDLVHLQDKVKVRLKERKQGCHGQGKISGKRNFFHVREKSGNFVDGQGNLERTWKVREKSGNWKINGCGRQS